MSDIKNFIASIKKNGLSRTNRYAVAFGNIKWATTDMQRDVVMFCDQIQLPGTNFNTNQIRTYGESINAPYERLYEDINMSFYVDTDLNVKSFFDRWMQNIQDPTSRTFMYYKEYISEITIEVQDIQNKTRYTMRLFDAFPKSIGAVQLDYNAKDIMKLSVNFVYKYYTVSAVEKLLVQDTIGSAGKINTTQDALNAFKERAKNFVVGAVGSKVIAKLPSTISSVVSSKLPSILRN